MNQNYHLISGTWRSDERCGADFPQENGAPAECDPDSSKFCCSEWGYCGNEDAHCLCDECVDYRKIN